MAWDLIILIDWHHELWVRLRVTMKDGSKHTGWCYIPGDHDWAYDRGEKKPFKCIRTLVNYHITHNEVIRLYDRYFEDLPIVKVTANQIRTFTITHRIFGIPVDEDETYGEAWYKSELAMRGAKNGN